jgi:riboflavin synthase
MFTGLIAEVGEIVSGSGELPLIRVASEKVRSVLHIGDSVAVNGACVTARELFKTGFAVEVSQRTLRLTGFGKLRRGSAANLEPALRVGDRMGGHFVSGHVDGVGVVRSAGKHGRDFRFGVELPSGMESFVFEGCSIAIDGISLTVSAVRARVVEFYVIPHTYENTIVRTYSIGTHVNVEIDLLARYVERLLSSQGKGHTVNKASRVSEWERWEQTE